ncbi:MAG: apolipoprotein N-acyltransferase [Isosphaeraceae bacterium]
MVTVGHPDEAVATRPKQRSPFVLAAGSGLGLWLTFPPADWGWLAWVMLVPLFLLIDRPGPRWAIYLGGWLGGLVFWLLAVQWVRLSDPSSWLAWVVLALVLSVSWPLFLFLTRWARQRLELPLILAAPIVWVALEYGRAHIVSGFPWYYLAHTQHDLVPLIQISDITGSLGVSLLVALVNAWIVDLLTLPLIRTTASGLRLTRPQLARASAVALAVTGSLAYGAVRLSQATMPPGPRVALLQSSLVQRLKMGGDPNRLLDVYRVLVDKAVRLAERPDLVVWPETSFPFSYVTIDPRVDDATLGTQIARIAPSLTVGEWRSRATTIASLLQGWADQSNVAMIVGTIAYEHTVDQHQKFNSALVFEPGRRSPQAYHKIHLVPFGEYVPFITAFPWLVALTPYDASYVPSLAFGPGPSWLDVGTYRYAVAICFEDTVPHVTRRFFSEVPDSRAPDVLVNLSNDGWFGGSSEHEMHLFVSLFRAIENRVPLVRAANTGISAIVDGNGRIVSILNQRDDEGIIKEGVLSGTVPLDPRASLYIAWGDWLGLSCLAVAVGLIPLTYLRPRLMRPR